MRGGADSPRERVGCWEASGAAAAWPPNNPVLGALGFQIESSGSLSSNAWPASCATAAWDGWAGSEMGLNCKHKAVWRGGQRAAERPLGKGPEGVAESTWHLEYLVFCGAHAPVALASAPDLGPANCGPGLSIPWLPHVGVLLLPCGLSGLLLTPPTGIPRSFCSTAAPLAAVTAADGLPPLSIGMDTLGASPPRPHCCCWAEAGRGGALCVFCDQRLANQREKDSSPHPNEET